MRQRTDRHRRIRVKDLSGGLLAKVDPSLLPSKYGRVVRNLRFSSGAPETRPGGVRAAQLTRPSGAFKFPGTTTDYVKVPLNLPCPLFAGLAEFTIEFVERPHAKGIVAADGSHIMSAGESGGPVSFAFRSKEDLSREVRLRDTGVVGSTPTVDYGSVDDDGGGDPEDRRYYHRIRRLGRDLDTLIVGAASGLQYNEYTDHFTSEDAPLIACEEPLFICGYGLDGLQTGQNSTIDEVRIWNRYRTDAECEKYTWLEYPMAEDPDLCLYLKLNEASGAVVQDDSIYGNDGIVVGTVTRVTGEVEGLMVGQFVGEFADGGKLHRLVAAGGELYREVIR